MPENLLITIGVAWFTIATTLAFRVTKAHRNDVRYNKKLKR